MESAEIAAISNENQERAAVEMPEGISSTDGMAILQDQNWTALQATEETTSKNIALITTNYTILIREITKNLKKTEPDMDDFHSFVINIFDASELPKPETIQELFDVLNKKKCMNCLDVSNLDIIVKEFSKELEDQNFKLIRKYKEDLAGFMFATKIGDFMNFMMKKKLSNESNSEEHLSITSEKAKYDKKYRKKLSIKLNGGNMRQSITFKSLEYVEKLWNSLCDVFEMPSRAKVLDSIVSGSIIITWIVQKIHAQKILTNIIHAVDFLKQEFIVGVYLEDICIYDEMSGIATAEVINYARLLMLEQEGKLQHETTTLESYFPDLNAPINQEGRSLLTMAAQCGHKSLLKFLLDHGTDAFHIDNGGKGVFRASAAHEDINIWLRTILENKMITSAKDGDSQTVRRALKFGIDPDAKENDEVETKFYNK